MRTRTVSGAVDLTKITELIESLGADGRRGQENIVRLNITVGNVSGVHVDEALQGVRGDGRYGALWRRELRWS